MPKQVTPRSRAPIDCSFDQLCKLDRDNKAFGDFWVIVDGEEVTIHDQPEFQDAKQSITIPKATMRRIIKFLTEPRPYVRK